MILLSALGLALPMEGGSQVAGVVAGEVRDADGGAPLAAVSVEVPGTGLGAVTDSAGRFRIEGVPPGAVDVRVARFGYAPAVGSVQLAAGDTAVTRFDLRILPVALDALVVTATGPQRRRELGNASTTLHVGRELDRAVPTSLAALLQGRAAGVQVLMNSGTVGTSATIRIRGNSSLNLDLTPLIYVDGARISNEMRSGPEVGGQNTSRLNDLVLDDIESIEVVRGPSAATLFGTEAAAGVILISTRRGRTGPAEWTFRTEVGASWDSSPWPDVAFHPRGLVDPAAADTVYHMNLLTDGRAGEAAFGTPWRTGMERSQRVSLRGGSEGITYFLSGEVGRSEGVLESNEATRRGARANLNLRPSSNVDLALSAGFGNSDVRLPMNDNTGEGFLATALIGFPWEMPLTRDDPVTGEAGVPTCPLLYEFSRHLGVPLATLPEFGLPPCAANPFFSGRTFADVASVEQRQQVERFTGSASVSWRPLAFLTAGGTLGYDQYSDQSGSFYPVDPALPFDDLSLGARTLNTTISRNLTLDGTLAASLDLSPGLVSTTTIGAQFFRQRFESTGALGRIFPAGPTTISNALRTEGSESSEEHRTLGLFLEQQVAFRDRLFVTPAVRVDDASAFGADLGRRAYPRVMASWVVGSPERVLGGVVGSLRLRGAWGRSGKQPGSLAALQLLEFQRAALRGQDVAGITFLTPGNPGLRPETGTEIELGWEADLLGGRVGVDFTWFHQKTTDAIVSRRPPPSSGYSEPLATNLGGLRSRGVEAGLFALLLDTPEVRWEWDFAIGTNRGRITRLEEPIVYGVDTRSQRHQEGYPFGSYFARDFRIGEDGEVSGSPEPVYMGQPTPEFEGSVGSTLRLFDRLTLHANVGFAGGHQQFNSTEEFLCAVLGGGPYGGTCPALFQRGPDGEPTAGARIKAAASQEGAFGPWIEDAGFARLRTVSARFDLPTSWMERFGGTRGSFTLAGENLLTLTGYSGLDPEVNAAGGRNDLRLEFLTLPLSRRLSGWLSITI